MGKDIELKGHDDSGKELEGLSGNLWLRLLKLGSCRSGFQCSGLVVPVMRDIHGPRLRTYRLL
jgi:hypothetical protein